MSKKKIEKKKKRRHTTLIKGTIYKKKETYMGMQTNRECHPTNHA